jgi:adenine-specific DNA-methyltransferase
LQGIWSGTGKDKQYHAWGQDASTARYYIDCFTLPGQVVLEPFVGGGTTPFVCMQLERHFIGFEVNVKTAEIARQRLATIQMPLPAFKASQMSLGEGA